MSKVFRVEVKFGKDWSQVSVNFTRQTDALHYVREHSGEHYPMRIVRVVKTVVFEGK